MKHVLPLDKGDLEDAATVTTEGGGTEVEPSDVLTAASAIPHTG